MVIAWKEYQNKMRSQIGDNSITIKLMRQGDAPLHQ
jgi:hypothetical protein